MVLVFPNITTWASISFFSRTVTNQRKKINPVWTWQDERTRRYKQKALMDQSLLCPHLGREKIPPEASPQQEWKVQDIRPPTPRMSWPHFECKTDETTPKSLESPGSKQKKTKGGEAKTRNLWVQMPILSPGLQVLERFEWAYKITVTFNN